MPKYNWNDPAPGHSGGGEVDLSNYVTTSALSAALAGVGGGLSFKGQFDPSANYSVGDVVSFGSTTFTCTHAVTGGGGLNSRFNTPATGSLTNAAGGSIALPGNVAAGDTAVIYAAVYDPTSTVKVAGHPEITWMAGAEEIESVAVTSSTDLVSEPVVLGMAIYEITAADITAGHLVLPPQVNFTQVYSGSNNPIHGVFGFLAYTGSTEPVGYASSGSGHSAGSLTVAWQADADVLGNTVAIVALMGEQSGNPTQFIGHVTWPGNDSDGSVADLDNILAVYMARGFSAGSPVVSATMSDPNSSIENYQGSHLFACAIGFTLCMAPDPDSWSALASVGDLPT